jgi:hypothetical protein
MSRFLSFVFVALFGFASARLGEAQSYKEEDLIEKPPRLSARDLLPESLLRGEHHTVASRVTNDGYFNNYAIESSFGRFGVEGQQLLEIRIGELQALAELDKLSSSKVFQDAALEAGQDVVMAPVNVVKKVANTVSDPDKMYETVKGVPEGAEKLFSWAYRHAKGLAESASEAVSPSAQGEAKGDAKSINTGATLKAGRDLGLRYIGYTKRERELFRKLQVNPYTSNQILKDEISRVASIETSVGVLFKFVPSIGLLSELGTFNKWYGRAEQLSLYEDPDVIKAKNRAELLALDVPEAILKEFEKNEVYTPWTRRFITTSLTSIGSSVAGRALFVKAAIAAHNEPTAMYFVSVAEALDKYNKAHPLKKIVASLYLPAGVTKDGILYVPLSVDYLFWTKEVAGIFADFRSRVTREEAFRSVEIHVRGRVSPKARLALKRLGATVFENDL